MWGDRVSIELEEEIIRIIIIFPNRSLPKEGKFNGEPKMEKRGKKKVRKRERREEKGREGKGREGKNPN